jgi:hypothetical protein
MDCPLHRLCRLAGGLGDIMIEFAIRFEQRVRDTGVGE